MRFFGGRGRRDTHMVAEIGALVGLLLYVGIVEIIVSTAQPHLTGVALALVSVVLAIIPAALWLVLFYIQDRYEPEPSVFVALVAILGALLAASVGQPLIDGFFQVPQWIGRNTLTEILGYILIVGFTQEFLKYGAVRFSMYFSSEFDQRIDGVVYGTAAGLGYGTMLNIMTVVSNGGVDLGVGVIQIVVTALVQGSLGGLTGYFLGRDKLDRMPFWWMPVGVTVAAVLNGVFNWLRGAITQAPLTAGGYNPWPALIAAIVLALLLLAGIFALMRSDLKADEGIGTP